ncbi:alpha/beta hydrolase [Solimonas sp. SE-A11]|uniref:alpha/beta hydrolase n=1 Tax=Solimonas sp. SE-A11 TaxID=3054954 RepID=UPI00259CDE7A|nr:alpha/beta hydrolase [Solimonas sp. SE-A11]
MRKLIPLFCLVLLAGCTGPGVLNAFTPSSGYNQAMNLPYDPTSGQTLDVYTPEGARNAPVVVFFYGGRWSEGDKQEYRFVGQALASRGIVAVVPNYRKYPQVRFPTFVEDGAQAVKWARNNAAAYGGNPEQLFVMGHSSGAHIAAMLALNESYLKKVGGSRSWLRGMIGLAGPYNFLPITDPVLRDIFGPPERFEQSQPIFFADGQNPPLLLLHGENDQIVWPDNTRSLAKAVANAGGPVETVIYPKMSHTLIIGAFGSVLRGSTDVVDHVDEFVKRMATYQRPSANTLSDIQSMPLEIESVPLSSP